MTFGLKCAPGLCGAIRLAPYSELTNSSPPSRPQEFGEQCPCTEVWLPCSRVSILVSVRDPPPGAGPPVRKLPASMFSAGKLAPARILPRTAAHTHRRRCGYRGK